jgi:hypothetical protein
METKKSYFPLLIEYCKSKNISIVQDPSEILSGESFKVLKTNYKS